jgi:signal transduction histidine kinase
MRLNTSFFVMLLFACFVSSAVLAQPNKADSIRIELNKSTTAIDIARNRIELARAILPDSLSSVSSMLKLTESAKTHLDANTIANLNNTKGLYYWYKGEFEQAIEQFKKTLLLRNDDVSQEYIAEAANNVGTLYRRSGQNDSSIVYLNISLDVDKQRGNISGIAKNYYELGVLYSAKSQFELAQRYLVNSMEYYEEIGNFNRMAIVSNSLGNMYLRLDDTLNAMQMYRKTEALALKHNNQKELATVYNNMAAIKLNFNKFEEGLKHSLAALEIANQLPYFGALGVLYANLATSYAKLNQTATALNYFRLAYHMLKEQQSFDKVGILNRMSDFYLETGWIDSAYFFINESMGMAKQIDSHDWISQGYKVKARIDSASGNFRDAYINVLKGIHIKDSVLSNQHRSRVEELRIIHEIDKKESENVSLKRQNDLKAAVIRNQYILLFAAAIILVLLVSIIVLQKRAQTKIREQQLHIQKSNVQLSQLNITKDKFLSILAHDLRSPFSTLLGLLEVIIDDYHELSDEQRKDFLMKLYATSNNTYNLVVNLLDWTMAQRNGLTSKPEACSIHAITNKVFSFLSTRAEQKSQTLINRVETDSCIYADPNIVSNILINLVNNAIKFTPSGGKIEVAQEYKQDEMLVFTISDNGIGIPEDKIETLFNLDSDFQRKGTNDENGTGLGLVLVKEFVEVVNGSIRVESKEGKGSKFFLSLPACKT